MLKYIVFAVAITAPAWSMAQEPAPPAPEQLQRWVGELGHPKMAVRRGATEALIAAGPPATKFVRWAEESPDLEVRTRAVRILRAIEAEALACWYELGGSRPTIGRGQVYFAYIKQEENAPAMLRLLPAFPKIEGFTISDSKLGEEGLEPIADVPWLKKLTLEKLQIEDDDLAPIAAISRLEQLSIHNCPITGSGLGYLHKHPRLQSLTIMDSPIVDDALRYLEGVQLFGLALARVPITDQGLAHIGRLEQLKSLTLGYTDVTDDGLVHLRPLKHLEYFAPVGTAIGDNGLKHLRDLPALKTLLLNRTNVTPAGTLILKEHTALRAISLTGTISPEELANIQSSFRNGCRIGVRSQ